MPRTKAFGKRPKGFHGTPKQEDSEDEEVGEDEEDSEDEEVGEDEVSENESEEESDEEDPDTTSDD